MNDRCDSSYESRQNPAYQSTLAHFFCSDDCCRCRATFQITQIVNHCGLISTQLLFPDFLESVIPECFYRVRHKALDGSVLRRNPGETGTGPPG
jgi:hypothetical protein